MQNQHQLQPVSLSCLRSSNLLTALQLTSHYQKIMLLRSKGSHCMYLYRAVLLTQSSTHKASDLVQPTGGRYPNSVLMGWMNEWVTEWMSYFLYLWKLDEKKLISHPADKSECISILQWFEKAVLFLTPCKHIRTHYLAFVTMYVIALVTHRAEEEQIFLIRVFSEKTHLAG